MRTGRKRKPQSLGAMLFGLTAASWETIAYRSLMMARGTCSAAEYARMAQEKLDAFNRTAQVLARSRRQPRLTALMDPWHAKATANARRLRKKKR